jgi:PAS domain S-box-containing protein
MNRPQSQELYRAVVEAMQEGAVILSSEGNILYSNPRFAELVALHQQQMMGQPIRALVVAQDQPLIDSLLQQRETEHGPVELSVRSSVGEVVPVALATRKFKLGQAQVTSMVITDLRPLRQREAHFHALMQNASEMTTVLAADGTVIYVSPSVERIMGCKPISAVGRNIRQFLYPPDFDLFEAHLGTVLGEPNAIPRNEFRFHDVDGSWHIVATSSVNRLEEPAVSGIVMHGLDITECKEAEQIVAPLTAIVSVSAVALLSEDSDPVITSWNAAAERLYGYSADEAIGQPVTIIVPTEKIEELRQLRETILRGETVNTFETLRRAKSGEAIPVELTVAPIFDSTGRVIGAAAIGRNIREPKRAEAQLLEIERVANELIKIELEQQKELNELKTRFVSIISHEYRQPLASIRSATDLLLRYFDRMSEARRHEALVQIQEQVKEMTALLEDVLMISRTERVGLQVNAVPTDLESYCTLLIAELKPVQGKDHRIDLSVTGSPVAVMLDQVMFRHVMMNLLSNALKYSPPSSRVTVAIDYGSSVRLSVRDEGIGIPSEDLLHLYELFFRASNVGSITGTGLGLSIVKRVVDVHGATISVASEVGRGTTFTITFPPAASQGIQHDDTSH